MRKLAISCALAGVALAAAWWWSSAAGPTRRSRPTAILRDTPAPDSPLHEEPAVRREVHKGRTTHETCRVEVVLTDIRTHASIDGPRRVYRATPESESLLSAARLSRPLKFDVNRGERLVIRAEAARFELLDAAGF